MNAETNRQARLERQQHELQERLVRIRRERDHGEVPVSADFADQAAEVENDEVLERLEESVSDHLDQIRHALAHLSRGGGDSCETCGEPIGAARLKAVPHATRCRRCADAMSGRHPLAA